MKKMLFFCFMIFLQANAGDLLNDMSVDPCDKITLNKGRFITESGLIERAAIGCLGGCCPSISAPLMRKKLKEEYLDYEGAPLARSDNADELLTAFLQKNDISICPLKRRQEVAVNAAQRSAAGAELFCTKSCLALVCLSAAFGCASSCYCGQCEYAFFGILPWCGFGIPFSISVDDSFMLLQWAMKQNKVSSCPQSPTMTEVKPYYSLRLGRRKDN